MSKLDAAKSGTFKIGGDIEVHRLSFGAMSMTGTGVWGDPEDKAGALKLLRGLPALGINLVDTADAYGPDVSEELIREALHPYPGMLVATKAGITRPGPRMGVPLGRPEYLVQQAYKSRRRLGVEQIGLWQLHRIDPKVPRDEQFDAVKSLINDGIIKHAGLSQVTIEEIEAASKFFKVATVQNKFNLVHRATEDVLDYCGQHGIGFMPWAPLARGNLTKPGSLLDGMAKKYQVTPGQIALAWILKRSPVMLPIPGTSKIAHLEDNVAAADVTLSDEEFAALDAEGKAQAE